MSSDDELGLSTCKFCNKPLLPSMVEDHQLDCLMKRVSTGSRRSQSGVSASSLTSIYTEAAPRSQQQESPFGVDYTVSKAQRVPFWERPTQQWHTQQSNVSATASAGQQIPTRSRQQHHEKLASTASSSQLSAPEVSSTLEHMHLPTATQSTPLDSVARMGVQPVHNEELIQQLIQQIEQLTQEKDEVVQDQVRKAQQLKNLQRSLNGKDDLLQEANQRASSLERSLNGRDALLQEASQRVSSLERSLNGKDALHQEAHQRVSGLERSLNGKDAQLQETNQQVSSLERSLNDRNILLQQANQRVSGLERSLNGKDARLQEANHRVSSLQRSLNGKDVLLQEANERVCILERSLNGKDAQLEEANQRVSSLERSLKGRDDFLQEANQRVNSLQLTVQDKDDQLQEASRGTQHLQQDVRELQFLLADAETRIAEGSQRVKHSDVMRIASQDIHLTDNKLGHGSYGEVRIAYWRSCPVAVKVLYEALAAYQRNIDLLLQEVNIAWKVHHPNVAAVCGFTLERKEEKTTAWIIMELLQGSMGSVIDASQGVGGLTLREQVDMAHDSLCGLDYLHSLPRSVLHGDIRPTNILITAVMGAKLGDLGAARFSDATLSAGLLSPEYTATERMDGRATQKSKETDVYSMGVTICELFTAATPSREERGDQLYLIRQCSVRSICIQMVSDDPQTRPSAGDVLTVINRLGARDGYKSCPPKRMVKGKIDGLEDVTLVQVM